MTDYSVTSGSVSGLTLSSGQDLSIYSGGTASGTYVGSGAIEIVYSGGTADNTIVANGGKLIYLPGANVADTTAIYADLIDSDAVVLVSGTDVIAVARGTFVGPPVSAGWAEFVLPGGIAAATTIDGAEIVYSGGTATGMTIADGGFEIVSGGGIAAATIIEAGGTMIALPGADILGSISLGGNVISNGVAVVTENNGNYYEGFSATNLSGTTIVAGENAYVLSGGTLTNAQDNSTVEIFSGGATIGTVIDNGASEIVHMGGSATGSLVGSGAVQYLYSGGTINNTEVSQGGAIDLTALAYSTGSASFNSSTDLLTVTENSVNAYVQLAGAYNGEYFDLSEDADGGTLVTISEIACYCRGTRIKTASGEIAVEDLAIGDHLITHAGRPRRLIWIGKRAYGERFLATRPALWPILIHAGALTEGIPARDLKVSPRHALFLAGKLIPAGALVNGGSIRRVCDTTVEYFHLELETHDVILAEGTPAESFVDDRNRGMFQNAPEYRTLYPDASGSAAAIYCAPRLEEGAQLAAIQADLARRGEAIGHKPPAGLTVTLASGINRVLVPPGTEMLRLVSDTARPPGEQRILGALITRLFLGGTPIDLADASLAEGFHHIEMHGGRPTRWTNGHATIELAPHPAARWCKIEVLRLAELAIA